MFQGLSSLCSCIGAASREKPEIDAMSNSSVGSKKAVGKTRPPRKDLPVLDEERPLTVEDIMKRRQDEANRGKTEKDKIEARYLHIKHVIVSKVNRAIQGADVVYSPEVVGFLETQDIIRKTLGCYCVKSKTANSKELISRRNEFATSALKQLKEVKMTFKRNPRAEAKISSQIALVSSSIIEELELKSETPGDRLQFFPHMSESPAEQSPEVVFDIFLAMQRAIDFFDASSKSDWVDKGLDELERLFGELAFILLEHTEDPSFLSMIVSRGITAFESFLETYQAWTKDTFGNTYTSSKESLQGCLQIFLAAKLDMDALEKRRAVAARKGLSVADFDAKLEKNEGRLSECAQRLYSAQKDFMSIESTRWLAQRYFVPELFGKFYRDMKALADTVLLSIDAMTDFKEVIGLFSDRRSLQQYDDIQYISPDMLKCTYDGVACRLRRVDLSTRTDLKFLFKQLVMQAKVARFILPQVSSIFVDNGYCYMHWEYAGEPWSTHVQGKEAYATNAVLMVHQMCRAVYEMHSSDVVHGDLQPSSWWVNESGKPVVMDFSASKVQAQAVGVRESVASTEPSFNLPEDANEGSSGRTKSSDIFILGKCVATICSSCKVAPEASELHQQLSTLEDAMTRKDPSKRLTAEEALLATFELLATLRTEFVQVREQRKEMENLAVSLAADRSELDAAAQSAEQHLGVVARSVEKVKRKERNMQEKEDRLVVDQQLLQETERKEGTLNPPSYWSNRALDGTHIIPIEKSTQLFQLFRHILVTDEPESLNKGRDVVERGSYTFLDLHGVWRIENSQLWTKYATQRRNLRNMLKERGVVCPELILREKMMRAQRCLPGADSMYTDINEVYLLHGTGAEALMSITENGINERFTTVALFGKGSYFAEDSGKTNQYVRGDPKLGSVPELHRQMFPAGGEYMFPEYPLKAYYLLFCRVVMGYPVSVKCLNARKKQMENISNRGAPIYGTNDMRELAPIPGISDPPIHYHSLVAEKGGKIVRFREMVQFHSVRVYPEYILCYSRK